MQEVIKESIKEKFVKRKKLFENNDMNYNFCIGGEFKKYNDLIKYQAWNYRIGLVKNERRMFEAQSKKTKYWRHQASTRTESKVR